MNALKPLATASLALILVGCAPSYAPAPETSRPSPTPTEAAPALNEHGNFPGIIGEDVAIAFPGTDTEAIRFKVTRVQLDPECTGDPTWQLPIENGQRVALGMEITTSPDYLEIMAAGEPLRVNWGDWVGYMPDGSTVANSGKALFCLPEVESLPLEIPAGVTTSATYVLDLPPGAVAAAWTPAYILGIEHAVEWPLN